MKTKKLLALLLIAALLLPGAAAAAEEDIPVYREGDTFELTFYVTQNPNLAVGAMLKLNYDHAVFESVPTSTVRNDIPILDIYLKGIPEGAEVTAAFRVLPGSQGGTYEIKIDVTQAADFDENDVDGLLFSSCQVRVDGITDGGLAAV